MYLEHTLLQFKKALFHSDGKYVGHQVTDDAFYGQFMKNGVLHSVTLTQQDVEDLAFHNSDEAYVLNEIYELLKFDISNSIYNQYEQIDAIENAHRLLDLN